MATRTCLAQLKTAEAFAPGQIWYYRVLTPPYFQWASITSVNLFPTGDWDGDSSYGDWAILTIEEIKSPFPWSDGATRYLGDGGPTAKFYTLYSEIEFDTRIIGDILEGVNIDITGGYGGVTGSSGHYITDIPTPFTGTITPSKEGYTFSPVSKSYANICKELWFQPVFTATKLPDPPGKAQNPTPENDGSGVSKLLSVLQWEAPA
jgi:hypothetical protein